jgi:hypothetical protein
VRCTWLCCHSVVHCFPSLHAISHPIAYLLTLVGRLLFICSIVSCVGCSVHQRFPNCGASPGGRCWASGKSGFFMWGTYLFWTKYGRMIKLCFGRHFACLKYFTYHLVSVLTPNYKEHVLSPVKLQKCVIHQLKFVSDLFTLINSGGGGRDVHETF